ncbi:MAG: hypothetical protein ACYTGJ_05115 [Planctomycetota bacterium]|jgi:hypothetical protein
MLLSPALPRLLPAGLLLLLAVGCVGSPAPTPVESLEPQVTERSYRTVVVDANGREDHESFVCYLGRARVTAADYDGDYETVTYIQDSRFVDQGYFLSGGATYRLDVDRTGELEQVYLGVFEPAQSVEAVTGASGPFRFVNGL